MRATGIDQQGGANSFAVRKRHYAGARVEIGWRGGRSRCLRMFCKRRARAQAGGDGGGQIGQADNMRQYINRLVGACTRGKSQGQIPVIRPPDGDIDDRRMTDLQALPDAQRFQGAPRARA